MLAPAFGQGRCGTQGCRDEVINDAIADGLTTLETLRARMKLEL
jgi:bacterioferritin-associated ferredoxin